MTPQKPTIEMAAFEAIDIRLCRIDEVEPILKNSKKPEGVDNPVKAFKLTLDTGIDKRECVTNLIQFGAEALKGTVQPFVLNLVPTEIRGVRSTAMILVASLDLGRCSMLSIRQTLHHDTNRQDFADAVGAVIV